MNIDSGNFWKHEEFMEIKKMTEKLFPINKMQYGILFALKNMTIDNYCFYSC